MDIAIAIWEVLSYLSYGAVFVFMLIIVGLMLWYGSE